MNEMLRMRVRKDAMETVLAVALEWARRLRDEDGPDQAAIVLENVLEVAQAAGSDFYFGFLQEHVANVLA